MDYDRWLQQPYEDAANRSAAIEEMIEDVLQEDEFNPCNPNTFIDAILEGCLDGKEDAIKAALDNEEVGHAALGTVMYEAVYQFCYDRAEDEAAKRYNDNLG
jgi:hypothetical protein